MNARTVLPARAWSLATFMTFLILGGTLPQSLNVRVGVKLGAVAGALSRHSVGPLKIAIYTNTNQRQNAGRVIT